MSAQVDWREVVERYAAGGPEQKEAVRVAKIQAQGLDGAEFWEAVHTLAKQAVAMRGAAEVSE